MENGSYYQTILFTDLFINIFGLGLLSTIYLTLSKNESNIGKAISHILIISFFSSIIGVILLGSISSVLASITHNPNLGKLILLFALNIPIFILGSIFNLTNIFLGSVRITTIINTFIALLKGVLLYSLHYNNALYLKNIFLILLFCNLLMLIFNIIVFRKNKISIFQSLDKVYAKEILKTAYPMGITNLLGFSYTLFAGFLISTLLLPKDYAIYKNGAIELPFISTITGAVTTVYLPILSKLVAAQEFKSVITIKSKLNILIASITYPVICLVIILAKDLIPILLSDKYLQSIPIFIIFSSILFIRITEYQDVLVSAGKSKEVLASNLIFVFCNFVLTIIGIKVFGILGAALGVLLSVFALATFLTAKTTKFLNIQIVDYINYYSLIKIVGISVMVFSPIFIIQSLFAKLFYACISIFFVYYIINKLRIADLFVEIKKIIIRNK